MNIKGRGEWGSVGGFLAKSQKVLKPVDKFATKQSFSALSMWKVDLITYLELDKKRLSLIYGNFRHYRPHLIGILVSPCFVLAIKTSL